MQVISTFSRWNQRHGPLVWTPGLSGRETDFWSAAGSGFRTCYAKENVEASNDSNVSLSFGVSFLAQNQVFKLWTLGVPQLRHMYGDSHVHAGELKEG